MSINLTVVIDNDEAIKKFKELEKVAKTSTSTIVSDTDKLDAAMRKIGSAVGALGIGFSFTELARRVADVRGEFQQLEVAFSTMLGSKAEANTLMEQAINLAATTPFDLQGVASGAKQLLAYGSTAKDVAGEIRMLGDIAAGMSLPLGDMVYLYGTTRTQGRLFTRDLMQFTGRGIPLMEELAKQFGVAKSQVGALVTAGKVGFAEVEQALKSMTSEGGKFHNLMEEQSKTITGQLSNLGDSITQMFNDIGKQSEGAINMAIGGASTLVENYQTIGREVIGIVGAYGSYKAAVAIMNAVSKARTAVLAAETVAMRAAAAGQKQLTTSTILLSKASKALGLSKLANPYVLVGAAVAVATYGIYKLITAKSAEEKAIESVNEKMEEYRKKAEEEKEIANKSVETMKNAEATTYERVKAYRKLIETYPELLDKYSEEEIKLRSIAALQGDINDIAQKRTEEQLQQDKQALEKKIEQIKESMQTATSVHGVAQTANVLGEVGSLQQAEKELEEIDKQLKQIAEDKEQAKFDALSDEEKLKIYEEKLASINAELEEYTRLLQTADQVRAKEITAKADELMAERDSTQKNIDAIKNKGKAEKETEDAEAAKKLALERLKVQEETHRAEIEARKAQIKDKVALLEYERDVELEAIRQRLLAAKDAIIESHLEELWEATKERFNAKIEDEINNKKTEGVMKSISFDLTPKTAGNNIPQPTEVIKTSADKDIPEITALFDDLRDKSVKDLLAIADAAQLMMFAFEDDPEKMEAIAKRISEIRKKAEELKTPFAQIRDGIKGIFTTPVDSEAWSTALYELKSGLSSIADVANGLDSVLESLGAGDALDGVVDGLNAALSAVDAAGKGAQMGMAFGGIGAAVGAAVGAVGSLVKSISQIHDKKREKNIQQLQKQIDGLERSYDQLGRAIDKTYSVDAGELIEQQNELLRQQKALIEQQKAEEQGKKNTDQGKLDEYQQQLDDINNQIEDNAARAAEAYTGISFDSFYDDFLNTLMDMDSSAADFADNFEKYITKAVLSAMLVDKYKARLEDWYAEFNTAMGDGKLTQAEKEALQREYQAIAEDAIKERDALSETLGIDGNTSSDKVSATSKGFQTMSEDTGSELNGRFTDIQGKVTEMRTFVFELLSNAKAQYLQILNIRDIMVQLNGNVSDIRTFTRVLPEMRDAMASMNRKLDNL